MNFSQIQTRLSDLQAQREVLRRTHDTVKTTVKRLKIQRIRASKGRVLIQEAATITQQQLEFHLSNIVTLALASVFDNPYEFNVKFESRRNSTECDLMFERNGKLISPLDSAGGGVVDVASFGLRIAYWAIKNSRPVIILDEPLKHLNDPTRELHRKAADMIKMVSEKLGLQMIIVSQVQELNDIADKVFKVTINKGESHVEEQKSQ